MTNPQKQTYKVPVTWSVEGELEVKAWDEMDARLKADEMVDKGQFPVITRQDHDSVEIFDPYLDKTKDKEEAVRGVRDERPNVGKEEQAPAREEVARKVVDRKFIDSFFPK